ncbi:Alanine--tRNA ligase [Frankliniella fusca]|uniref:Alanine--tRNA ligase n=1 Tax=Frankliniella fusca TaxID=407009 RepID=A0AAE1HLX3_9NEOP|nr:Alanine--tRNA ligase [Frankliniella fusca]
MKRTRNDTSLEKENESPASKKRGPYLSWAREGKKMPKSTRYSRSAESKKPPQSKPRRTGPPNVTRAKSARAKSPSKSCASTMQEHSGTASNPGLDKEIQLDSEVQVLSLVTTERNATSKDEILLTLLPSPPAEEVSGLTWNNISVTPDTTPRASPDRNSFENDHFEIVGDEEVNCVESTNNEDKNAHFDDSFISLEATDLQPCPVPDDSSDDDADNDYAKASGLHLTINQKIDLLLLLATKRRHNLTYSAAEDIMNLAGVVSDKSGFLPTRHIMKKTIELYSACDMTEHHVCPQCGLYIGVISSANFTYENCNRDICTDKNRKGGNMFISISLRKQLESIIRNCFKHIVDRRTRKKISAYNYEDIYDAEIYNARVAHKELSFNFFVDGLQIASTSKQSAWPVLGCLNELPLSLRRKHVFMASIWLGLGKPNCQQYLKPFVQECNLLAEKGIQMKIGNKDFNFKVKALMCVSDTVARPLLRNSSQFNGIN